MKNKDALQRTMFNIPSLRIKHVNKIIFTSFLFLISIQFFAQSYKDLEKMVLDYKDKEGVTKRLDYVMRNEFSQIISTNANGMIGDFIGLSTKDNTLSLAYNFVRDKSSWEINFSGGVNDNIAGIFANNKLKSGVQIGLKYNVLIGDNKIGLVLDDVVALRKTINDLDNKNNLEDLKYDSEKSKFDKIYKEKSQETKDLEPIIEQLKKDKASKKKTFKQSSLDELIHKLETAKLESKAAKESFDYYDEEWASGIRDNLHQKKRKATLDKFRTLRAHDFDLTWVSIGAGFANESYNLFDPSLKLDKQLFAESDFIPSFNISYSQYTNDKNGKKSLSNIRKVTLLTIGGSIKYGNNLNTLSEVEVETVDSVSANRFVISTQKAFSGMLIKNEFSAQVYFDYYKLGYSKANLGFHFRGTVDFDQDFPDISLRGGIIFSAMNRDNTKSNINFEIFYGLNNILKVGGEDSFLKRNILGIQTTFPFNLKN